MVKNFSAKILRLILSVNKITDFNIAYFHLQVNIFGELLSISDVTIDCLKKIRLTLFLFTNLHSSRLAKENCDGESQFTGKTLPKHLFAMLNASETFYYELKREILRYARDDKGSCSLFGDRCSQMCINPDKVLGLQALITMTIFVPLTLTHDTQFLFQA